MATHWLTVQRIDGASFQASDLTDLRAALFGVLSFARGALVGIALPTGFDSAGAVTWCEWSVTLASPWKPRLTWFDDTCSNELGALLTHWIEKADDEFWRDVLQRAVRIVVSANDADPLDVSIPTACTGLELLAWAVLEIDQQWLKEADGELNTAGRFRLLLRWADIAASSRPNCHRSQPVRHSQRCDRHADTQPFRVAESSQ